MSSVIQSPTICIISDAKRADINRVWEAMGRGPGTFSVPLGPIGSVWSTPPTHWLMSDMGTTPEDAAVWGQMAAAQDLPPLPEGVIWGEEGVIHSATAQAAMVDLRVHTVYGLADDDDGVEQREWLAGILSGAGLIKIPDPVD